MYRDARRASEIVASVLDADKPILNLDLIPQVYARSHNRTDFELLRQLKTASHWLPLYNQPNGGASIGPFGEKLLENGQCPSKDL